ncbi:hypothetical protein HYG81_11870 [Natrinema zhouii]|uniref:Uncharacterized protein n=1 Tax=Natrinema zhouii TaxID=1710539 RepID=A0A7D6H3V0_9EURY|nr:hypothetical protein [Natrinema zhouii]QLK24808.1 hypothetical protein HYG81_11870 [Natrinema zhouii]
MNRRTYVVSAGVGVSSLLAGCLSDASSDENSGPDDSTNDNENDDGSDGETGPGPNSAIDAYLDAAEAEDTDALLEVVHNSSPLYALYEDPEWEFESGEFDGRENIETELITEDGSVADILELEGASFWFDEGKLESEIGNEDIALVRAELADQEAADESGIWVLVTEDDEWTVFWVGGEDDTPDDPEAAFKDPIEDADNDVIDEIEWDVDPNEASDGFDPETTDFARVHFTDSPGLEAETVRLESTIAGAEFELYNDESGGALSTWADSWVTVQFDPNGDQIVVTAIEDGTETIVHREHYEPTGSSN